MLTCNAVTTELICLGTLEQAWLFSGILDCGMRAWPNFGPGGI